MGPAEREQKPQLFKHPNGIERLTRLTITGNLPEALRRSLAEATSGLNVVRGTKPLAMSSSTITAKTRDSTFAPRCRWSSGIGRTHSERGRPLDFEEIPGFAIRAWDLHPCAGHSRAVRPDED
jgi:hypothetical protein